MMEKLPKLNQKETINRLEKQLRELKEENALLKKELEEKSKEIALLKKEATLDALTGLSNRRTFSKNLRKKINEINFAREHPERRKETIKTLSLLFIDVDNFKKINDEYGHDAGDKTLKTIAEVIKESIRSDDLCARWGGEEIIVALLNAPKEIALKKAEEIRKKIKDLEIKIGETTIKPTVSIGVSELGNESDEELIKQADMAMYESKRKGKNQSTLYNNDELNNT